MITADMHRDAEGLYKGFTLSGHAEGYEGDAEYDLVCAAVSAVTLTTAMGLQNVLHLEGTFDSHSGFLDVDIASPRNEKSQVLIETMLCGLKSIRAMYPDKLKILDTKG